MPIERPDWDEPTDVPAPAPQKSQSISRPDWTAPADDVPVPVEGRPDWNESDLPVEVSKSETHPDWPIEVDESAEEAQEHLVAAEPEEVTPLVDNMIAELAETGEHDLSVAHEAIEATLEAVPAWDRAEFESDFESLPPGAQKAIVGELASPRNEWEGLAGEDELENFASTTEGA